MAETFTRFDAADYLTTEEDMALYLSAAAEEGDTQAIITALGTIARAQDESKLALRAGMTRERLQEVLSGKSDPAFRAVTTIAHALGFTLRFATAE